MNKDSFFKSLSWLVFLNLLIKPLWIFGIDRSVQNLVGHTAYGSYFALFNLTYVLLFIADAGLSNMLNQRIAAKIRINTHQLIQLKFLLLFIYGIVCCFIGWLTHISQWIILFYVIGIQMLTSLFVFLRSILTASQHFKPDALFSVLDKGLMILLCGGFIYGLFEPITLQLFLKFQLLSTGLAVLFVGIFLQHKRLFVKHEKEAIAAILKWTLPFAVIILLMSVHYRLDAFLLERLRLDGAMQAGIYATAYRLLDAGNMVGYLAASFLVPFIARNKEDKNLISHVVLLTRHGLLFFAIGVTCFGVVFAPWLQQVLYGTKEAYNTSVFGLCLLSLPAYYLVHVYGSVLTATSQFKTFITILLLSVLLNIFLNIMLIQKHGALGCCIAALFSQYSCGIALCIAASRKFQLPYSARWVLFYLLFAASSFFVFYFLKTQALNVWIILVATVVIAFAVLATQRIFIRKLFSTLIK